MTLEDSAILMVRHGLTPRKYIILSRCWQPIRMVEIAQSLKVSTAAVTGLVDALERDGLVKRRNGMEGDRRAVSVSLTESGRAKVRAMMEEAQELDFPPNHVE